MALRRTTRIATTAATTMLMLNPPLTWEWFARSIAPPIAAIASSTRTAVQPPTPRSLARDAAVGDVEAGVGGWPRAAYAPETCWVGASQPSSWRTGWPAGWRWGTGGWYRACSYCDGW